ncbi:MAG: hypothetical protein HY748_00630 [Elusimicrobia bacterium]|nr:hypothetical protein [Elusimicrobiota bacterium]
MTNLFAGLLAAGLLVPAHGEGIRIGTPVTPTSLPSYPIPIAGIGRPAIQLPSPALPMVGFPNVGPQFNFTASLPSPVTVPATRLPEPVLPTIAVVPEPVLPVEVPRLTNGPVGPAQYPRTSPNPDDPLPVGIPVTVKSKLNLAKIQAVSGKFEAATASLKAVFDNAEKPATAHAVEIKEEKAQDRPVTVESERRITLPEWDLENEIGINPIESTW